MKKRFLVTLLTLALSISALTGCGSSSDSSSAPANTDSNNNYAVVSDTTVDTSTISNGGVPEGEQLYEGPTILNSDTESSTVESDIVDDYADEEEFDKEFGRPPEDECITEEEITTREETSATDIEGIIMAQVCWPDLSTCHITVYEVNPVTGISRELNQFTYGNLREFDVDYIQPPWQYAVVPFENRYNVFSNDYTKVAATKTIVSSGERHTGWLDANGNFFDVTVALGEQAQDDFDELARHSTIGFQGDTFLYMELDDKGRASHYYGVDTNNVVPGAFWEIDAADKLILASRDWFWLNGYKPTCWVDNDRFLVEAAQGGGNKKCRIATASTKTLDVYLPGEDTNSNWNAVASPDGSKVAFFSQRLNGEDINIYIASISGENPKKLEPNFTPSFAPGSRALPISGGDYCYILEWR